MLTASAMTHYEHQIEQAVVLALFIPLLISSGGNTGSQATTLIIRAMALGELRLKDWWRVIGRELAAGIFLGCLLGYMLVGLTIALSLLGIVTFGTVAGSMLPFILRRCGLDPASASAPFVATLVDVTGIIIYFSVAKLILTGTLL
jgi:magnesium transporter